MPALRSYGPVHMRKRRGIHVDTTPQHGPRCRGAYLAGLGFLASVGLGICGLGSVVGLGWPPLVITESPWGSEPSSFFVLAGLLYRFGEPIKGLIEKHFGILSLLLVVGLMVGFALLGWL